MGLDFSDLVPAAVSLRAAAGRIEPPARAEVGRAAFRTVAQAQVAAPVDTGALKSSITADLHSDGFGYDVGPEVNYGHFVEYGTSGPYEIPGAFGRSGSVTHPGIGPQPYLGPAYEQNVDRLGDQVLDKAEQALS